MKTILVADGDNSVRNIVRLLFTEKMGYRVVAVSKGADAILKAKEIIPDIVLADAHLSDKDGYQVAGEIKSDPFLRSTRVLLLNSACATLDKKKALKAHVDGVIIKPFGTEVVEKVGYLLNHTEKKGIRFIPIIHPREISKRYAAEVATLYGKLAKSAYIKSFRVIVQTIALNLKGSYRLARGFTENLKAIIEGLKHIRISTQILVTKSLSFSSVAVPIRKYVAKFEILYKKLIEQKKYNYSKSFKIIAQSVTKHLEDYCQAARGLAGKFRLAIGKLRKTKVSPRILTVRSLEPSLVPLFFTRGSLISLIGMGILLLITTFIPSSNKKLEGTSSFFNTSVSTSGLTDPESKPNFDVKFYDDARDKNLKETVGDIDGQYTNEKLSEAIIKENHKPSRKKQTSRKIRRKSDYKDLPEKDLKEVLKGAFLLQ